MDRDEVENEMVAIEAAVKQNWDNLVDSKKDLFDTLPDTVVSVLRLAYETGFVNGIVYEIETTGDNQ